MIFHRPFDEKPDVIVASSPSLFTIVPAWLFAKRWNAKLLFEARDLWPLTLTTIGKHSQWHPVVIMFSLLEKFAYRVSHCTVSLLPNAIEYMRTVGLKDEKFHYIPNGVETGSTPSDESPLPFEIEDFLRGDRIVVTYAGSLGISNAMDYFIDAAIEINRESNRFAFLVIGRGPRRLGSLKNASRMIIFCFTDLFPGRL